MDDKQIEPHIEDISRVLGDKVDKEQIKDELLKNTNVYKLDLGEAKRMIVKKHGGDTSKLNVSTEKELSELGTSENSVDVLCRIVFVAEKEIQVNGNKKTIHEGRVGDGTTTVRFTAWTDDFPFEKGDVIRIKDAYTKGWQGEPQLNFGDRVVIKKESKDALPPFKREAKEYKVKDFYGGLGSVIFTAKILSIEKREVNVGSEKKTVYSGILADETAKASFSVWHNFKLKKGDVIRVEGAYTKTWRGLPQVNFDDNCDVKKLKGKKMDVAEAKVGALHEIERLGGAIDILVRGVIVDVKKGSGLIFRCPECNRVVQNNICRSHGNVEGLPDLRIKAVIDDGTSTLTIISKRDITEKILKKSMDQCLEIAKKSFNYEVIQGEVANVLLGRAVEAHGNITSDDFGLMMVADNIDYIDIDVQTEARQLLKELGVE